MLSVNQHLRALTFAFVVGRLVEGLGEVLVHDGCDVPVVVVVHDNVPRQVRGV